MAAAIPDTLVIGGGITGLACAIHLQRKHRRVTLLDPDEPARAASYGNAGVLARCAIVPVLTPGTVCRIPSLLLQSDSPLFLSWSHLPKMANWLRHYLSNARASRVRHIADHLHPLLEDSVAQHQNLAKGTPAAKHVVPSPYLFVYPDAASQAADRFTWELRAAKGYVPEIVEGEQLRELAGGLATPGARGLLLQDHGRIDDPGAYLASLRDVFTAAGGKLAIGLARAVVPAGKGIRAAVNGQQLAAANAVICAGAWSGGLLAPLGCNVTMESERGYHLELANVTAPAMPVMDAKRKVVVSPMATAGRVRLSGLVDLGGLGNPPNPQAVQLLRKCARQLFPAATIPQDGIWLGNRPAPWDSLPLLGTTPASERIIVATGMHHVGLTAGPKIGQVAAQLACDEKPDLPLAAYRPDRG